MLGMKEKKKFWCVFRGRGSQICETFLKAQVFRSKRKLMLVFSLSLQTHISPTTNLTKLLRVLQFKEST